MKNPLLGVVLKLNRAEAHLHSVMAMINEFFRTEFFETSTEIDRRGRLIGRAINVKQPPPELSVLIGDCVFNYRSALDQLAYALAAGNTDQLPDSYARTSAFPIYQTGPKYRGRRGRPARVRMRGMSATAQAVIERLQPFHRRKYPELRLLWMLEELSNVDKHRLVHLGVATQRRTRYTVKGPGFYRLEKIEANPGPVEEDRVLVRVYGEFDLEVGTEVIADVIPEIVFDPRSEARSVRNWPVMPALGGIRAVILDRVIPALAPELQRLYPTWQWEVKVIEAEAVGTSDVWSQIVASD